MITRFDHSVIAVRDLEEAIQLYTALGFEVKPGGRHNVGTYNALIRFGLDYLELLSVFDVQLAYRSEFAGRTLLDFFSKREGGLVGYALATSDIQQEAGQFQEGPLETVPFPMQRKRPDGNLLTWRLLVPGNVSWRRPWPFLIQWDVPDEKRLAWEGVGTHANGVTGWRGIAVAVHDLEQTIKLYTASLGLRLHSRDEALHFSARRATFQLGPYHIELLEPVGEGPVQRMLTEIGEGPFEITLISKDLLQTRNYLAQAGIAVETHPGNADRLLLPVQQTFGARIALTQQG
ncbi:hypothetical protein EPA93_23595 [Ktedonosporobacter rubrisoli]|uniref:VOC domain-containing protein n=1 Tax=Ktedonosporobacter rubrisoli TaxID=2509675 RepID=A0A4P6JTB2_KTERU|nr:VOC family protein [Ktedonosporobacter rubrisoli]QBD78807.1 hypothetical protein EPA93_23595 [Ktedonosporobacter rubrisoli]